MKVLIYSIVAGNGHNSCAKAMKSRLLEQHPDWSIEIIDFLKTHTTRTSVWTADSGYAISSAYLRKVYNIIYEQLRKRKPDLRWNSPAQSIALQGVSSLLKEIVQKKPDLIFCTHFYPAIALTDLKLLYHLPCKIILTNLDYVHSPFFESCIGVDYFNETTPELAKDALRLGFEQHQILEFGLPAHLPSAPLPEKMEARTRLGLATDLTTIVVMFGGGYWNGGLKIFKQVIRALKGKEAQIIMINGRNTSSYKAIAKMKFPNNIKVVNLGFTDHVLQYFAAADFAVSKVGGLSITEMFYAKLPSILSDRVPGQEMHNLAYATAHNTAIPFHNYKHLQKAILSLYENVQLRESMAKNTYPLRKNGLNDLAAFIGYLPPANYTNFLQQEINYNDTKKQVKQALKKAHKEKRKHI